MLKKDLHRLLKRQLLKSGINESEQEKYAAFLTMVNSAYRDFDKDLIHLEHILEQSSRELFKKNKALQYENDNTKNQLNDIVNTINGVLFETDLKGNFIYLNNAWKDISGLSLKSSLHKNYRELLVGKNETSKKELETFFLKTKGNYRKVFKYYKPSNVRRYLELNLSITYTKSGKPKGTIGTLIDVTNLKETEIKLNLANKAKDDFLSTMSHEMRTPLNAIIGLSNILLMENYLPQQLENLQAMKYSGEHLLNLINDVLDINKIQSGKMKIDNEDFSLTKFLKTIQTEFKYTARKKYIVFTISKDKSIPDYIIGDRYKLAQVIKNLLSNAFKFTDIGAIVLVIKLVEIDAKSVLLKFSVKDTGIGIAKQKQKDIFKQFVQAELSTTRLYGGTGLGLTISSNLLKLQNSQLNVQSEEGKGSEFSFKMKFKLSHLNDILIAKKEHEKEIDISEINLRVLVAEDNKLNALVLEKLFEKWNVANTIKQNGKELLEEYSKREYDLILMDLQMPILDGYETTKLIRGMSDKQKASIPIIALTAFAQPEIQHKTAEFKMDGFMSKPFDPNEFHKLLSFYSYKANKVF